MIINLEHAIRPSSPQLYSAQAQLALQLENNFPIKQRKLVPAVPSHRVLGKVLTLNISTIRETLIFRCGIVIRIIPYAYFSPPPSLPFT